MMRFLFSVFLSFVSVAFSFAQDDPGYEVKMFLNQINREIYNKTGSLNERGLLNIAYSDTCLVRWREDNLNFKNECKEYVKEIERAYAGYSGYLDKIAKDYGEIGFDKKEFMTGEYLYYYMTYPAFFYNDINRKIRNLPVSSANIENSCGFFRCIKLEFRSISDFCRIGKTAADFHLSGKLDALFSALRCMKSQKIPAGKNHRFRICIINIYTIFAE